MQRFSDEQVLAPDVRGGETFTFIGKQAKGDVRWVLVRLARKVAATVAIPLTKSNFASDLTKAKNAIFSIGYPSGLPLKVAAYAKALPGSDTDRVRLFADLDTFSGNSGGSIYRARDGKLVGILVGGEEDYRVPDGSSQCRRACVFTSGAGASEEATRIGTVELPED